MKLTTIKLVRKSYHGGVGRFLSVQPNVAAGLIRDGIAEPAEQAAKPKPQPAASKPRRKAVKA